MIIGHGGNKQALAARLGCSESEILDMSSNLNPLGPPDMVVQTLKDNISRITFLPHPDACAMKAGFARFHGIDPDRVIASNGTTWFIYTLPLALNIKKAIISGPTYADYADACRLHRVAYQYVHASFPQGFFPDMDHIYRLAGSADMVFICNPNNPTGVMLEKEQLEYLVKAHESTLFVIDESYLPFADPLGEHSLINESGYDNVIVLSSMSKIYRIPGLRTGFLTGPALLAEKIMAHYQPWSVNALAQAVIEDIFDHPDGIRPFYTTTEEFTQTEKALFLEQIGPVEDLEPIHATTYFVLARLTGTMTAPDFCDRVGDGGILIRDCSNFEGLSDRFVRFSLSDRQANQRLARQIRQVMGHA